MKKKLSNDCIKRSKISFVKSYNMNTKSMLNNKTESLKNNIIYDETSALTFSQTKNDNKSLTNECSSHLDNSKSIYSSCKKVFIYNN